MVNVVVGTVEIDSIELEALGVDAAPSMHNLCMVTRLLAVETNVCVHDHHSWNVYFDPLQGQES